jgi:hypothetical protein
MAVRVVFALHRSTSSYNQVSFKKAINTAAQQNAQATNKQTNKQTAVKHRSASAQRFLCTV